MKTNLERDTRIWGESERFLVYSRELYMVYIVIKLGEQTTFFFHLFTAEYEGSMTIISRKKCGIIFTLYVKYFKDAKVKLFCF